MEDRRSREIVPGERGTEKSLFITPDAPALHRGGFQTTAQPATLTQTVFHFCEVELGRLLVDDVIFIIIIIIDIIVSLPLLFYESKVLDTSLAEDVTPPETDTRRGDGRCRTPVFGTTVMVLLAGRLLASVHFFRVNTLPIYRSDTTEKPHQCTVYLLYNSKQS